jgi:hypothetical protein
VLFVVAFSSVVIMMVWEKHARRQASSADSRTSTLAVSAGMGHPVFRPRPRRQSDPERWKTCGDTMNFPPRPISIPG